MSPRIWIARDYIKCSGCRRCEIACSISHEGKIWPEASRIRIFMLTPGAEIPHFCAQCHDHPCLESCPTQAISVSNDTGAMLVDREKCTACGNCIDACPGRIPHLHPTENYSLICDLCRGDPQCVKVCSEGGWDALWIAPAPESYSYRLYARKPEELTKELLIHLLGEKGFEMI